MLEIWEKVRRDWQNKAGPLELVGHLADCRISLSALVTLMTLTEYTVANGIFYLGLCISDEKDIVNHFRKIPSIAYFYYNHLRRTLLGNLRTHNVHRQHWSYYQNLKTLTFTL